MPRSPRHPPYYPTLHEIAALRVLARKDDAYAREVSHGSCGEVPLNQVYMILRRLRLRGAVVIRSRKRIPPEGGLPQKLYRITAFGRRCIRAIQILEERHP